MLWERFAPLVLKVIHFLLPWKQLVDPTKSNLRDTSTPSNSSRKGVLVPSCPLCSKPMIRRQNRVNKGSFWGCQQWPMCNGTRRPWERGKDEAFTSSMTKVLSTIFAAAQFLDSSCADCWNRAVRCGRPDLLEMCVNSDSPLVNAVESAGGEGLRASFWNGYDLTARRGRERFHVFCSEKGPRHVWFSSPCRVPGTSSQRVSRILQGIADVFPRVQALGCHVHFSLPLILAS